MEVSLLQNKPLELEWDQINSFLLYQIIKNKILEISVKKTND